MSTPVREIGDLSLSIGSSLALEVFFGLRQPPTRQPGHTKFSQLWVNLETLLRNVVAAYTADDLDSLTVIELVTVMLEELEFLEQAVLQHNDKLKLVVYYDDPAGRDSLFPHAAWRVPTTNRQSIIHRLTSMTLAQTLSAIKDREWTLTVINREPPKTPANVAMLTHHAHNLLWWPNFNLLRLLESRTGKLKGTDEWSGKLKNIDVDAQIPFNALTLQVFGDNGLFAGESRTVRRELKTLAFNANWTKITTRDKIVSDMRTKGSVLLKETYNKLMSRF